MSPIWFWPKKTICGCNCSYYLRFFFFFCSRTPWLFQESNPWPTSYRRVGLSRTTSPLCCPNSYLLCRRRASVSKKAWILFSHEDTVIPPVVDVQVEQLCRCWSSTTQPWQSRQIGGQLSGLATQETRWEVKLNWFTRERSPPFRQSPAPPFNELEVPLAACSALRGPATSHKWGKQENEVIRRCPWSFKWQRIKMQERF